jgi:hypothetical protein
MVLLKDIKLFTYAIDKCSKHNDSTLRLFNYSSDQSCRWILALINEPISNFLVCEKAMNTIGNHVAELFGS